MRGLWPFQLAVGVNHMQVTARSKSLFSTMKKLLQLDNLSAGGRARSAVHDILGVRVVLQPRLNLLAHEAESDAIRVWTLVMSFQPPSPCLFFYVSTKKHMAAKGYADASPRNWLMFN